MGDWKRRQAQDGIGVHGRVRLRFKAHNKANHDAFRSISRSRTGVVAIEAVKSGDSDDDGNSSDDSDRKSKMSFSYWGADKITVDPIASAKARASVARTSTSTRRGSASPVAYTRPEVGPIQPSSLTALIVSPVCCKGKIW